MVSIGAHSAMSAGELPALPRTSREVVVCLRQHGPLSAEELAERLHVTTSTVRQALAPLRAGEYVEYSEQGSGRGRRRHVYALTAQGHALFPGPPRDLVRSLIAFIQEEDPELLRRFLADRWSPGGNDRTEHLETAPFAARIRALVDAYDQSGFFPVTSRGDRQAMVFTLVNCPLLDLARAFPDVCGLDEERLEALVPGCRVERTAWRLQGDPLCTYVIHPSGG
ncbi:MAG: hypothetical protein Kow0010_15910 [Dehalococcoidia bacterium]